MDREDLPTSLSKLALHNAPKRFGEDQFPQPDLDLRLP
jgi:hypothetical protein